MTASTTTRQERARLNRDALISTQVNDFVIEERIGEGGMGIVYRAAHPLIGKQVAIKVLRSELVTQEQVERLLVEARAVNAIRHPGIIDIFGFGQLPDGRPYIIMELLQGQSLSAVLQQRSRLNPNTAVWILDQMLAALGAAHAAGVVHRDLKPGNVFLADVLDGSRVVKLVDFGIAKLVREQAGPATVTGAILGTPEYMSPEQIRGNAISAATDLYAVGVIAFQMLTGERPFKGDQLQVLFAHVEQPPPLPSSLVSDIPSELDALVLRLLAKSPSQRPESADAVRRALKQIPPSRLPPLDTEPTSVMGPLRREGGTKSTASQIRLDRPMLRRFHWALAAGGVLLSTIAATAVLRWPRPSATETPPEPVARRMAPVAPEEPVAKQPTPNAPSPQPLVAAAPTVTPPPQPAVPEPQAAPPEAPVRTPTPARSAATPTDPKLVHRIQQLTERYEQLTSGHAPIPELEKELKRVHARAQTARTRSQLAHVNTSLDTLTQRLDAVAASRVPSPLPSLPPVVALPAPDPQFLALLTTPKLTPPDEKLARRFAYLKSLYLVRSMKRAYPKHHEDTFVQLLLHALKADTATQRMDIHRALDEWKAALDRATPK
ncbi:serine/threonine protein kinase [Myxococcus stipitatus DSM 14675]|uniref:non-specific serine/threonine protein kinase n=1 Tax=Myxococcus stipitatus (strain DSM 14675 / JCM 12634 / Mx s8) TaxID=1278073 RepID=L7URV8_MYXSD|nr:serine/threonine protein kinase [Myxococcus stipitatus]AGC49354.1 serine/threonine protein kinase [Myxococcus stipitatus DSM 14675]